MPLYWHHRIKLKAKQKNNGQQWTNSTPSLAAQTNWQISRAMNLFFFRSVTNRFIKRNKGSLSYTGLSKKCLEAFNHDPCSTEIHHS